MDRDKKIDRIVRGWYDTQTRTGLQFGLDRDTLAAMASLALDAADGPEEWEPGETIPTTQHTVYDNRWIQWERASIESDGDAWSATLTDADFQNQVGTVYERPAVQGDRTHGPRVDGKALAYLQVLAHAADVLDAATDALAKTGRTYRDKRGFTAGLCREVENQAELTGHASTTIKELIKEAEGK